jgi:hypothetical protein
LRNYRYFNTALVVEDLVVRTVFALGPEADTLRARALSKIATDPTRVSDHGASGPDRPCDDSVRHRFFGEI